MAYAWQRQRATVVSSGLRADMNLTQVPVGKSIIRTIFGWSAFVQIPMQLYELTIGRPVFAGINTVRSGFGGTLPHPDTSPLGELSYPSERWLYWEMAELVSDNPGGWQYPATHVTMHVRGTTTARECETAVLNVYAAQTLDVHLAIESSQLLGLGIELTCSGYVATLVSP